MSIRNEATQDNQVADFFAYRKMHLSSKNVEEILEIIKQKAKVNEGRREDGSVCHEWAITISLEDTSVLPDEKHISPETHCQVIAFNRSDREDTTRKDGFFGQGLIEKFCRLVKL